MEEGSLCLIDQRKLPYRTEVIGPRTIKEQVDVINTLAIRGAPAIGVFGALSLALAIGRGEDPGTSYSSLVNSRPTAVDLRNCLDIVMKGLREGGNSKALSSAEDLMSSTIESCRRIGENGKSIIPDGGRVTDALQCGGSCNP